MGGRLPQGDYNHVTKVKVTYTCVEPSSDLALLATRVA